MASCLAAPARSHWRGLSKKVIRHVEEMFLRSGRTILEDGVCTRSTLRCVGKANTRQVLHPK
eukprot:4164027-Prorocentrum_lima.AAC.1